MYRRITLTTDLSPASQMAFLHALAMARHWQATLDVVHVHAPDEEPDWQAFPQVRATLHKWGAKGLPDAISRSTSIEGMHINKVELPASNAAAGLTKYILEHQTDLVVAASHGRQGVQKIIRGSVMEEVLLATRLPALLFGPDARPFVNAASGALRIATVVLPVARHPSPDNALYELSQFTFGGAVETRALHVAKDGEAERHLHGLEVQHIRGANPAHAIVGHAAETEADLIAMTTEGPKGLKDKLFGTTTEQVMAKAPCPVLVVPAD